jgi:hypothetical protein
MPIETAPQNTWILCYRDIGDDPKIFVDKYREITREEENLVSSKGNRRIYEILEIVEREWVAGYCHSHWMPLPEPP